MICYVCNAKGFIDDHRGKMRCGKCLGTGVMETGPLPSTGKGVKVKLAMFGLGVAILFLGVYLASVTSRFELAGGTMVVGVLVCVAGSIAHDVLER